MNDSRDYKFTVTMELPMSQTSETICFLLPTEQARPFKPMDVCDSAICAMAFDGVTESGAQKLKGDRHEIASEIAENITKALMKLLGGADTANGYPKEAERKGLDCDCGGRATIHPHGSGSKCSKCNYEWPF